MRILKYNPHSAAWVFVAACAAAGLWLGACSASDSGTPPYGAAGSTGAGGTNQGGAAGAAQGGAAGTISVGGGTSGGAAGAGGGCSGISATASAVQANVLVLIDMSGTMKDKVDGQSKYDAVLGAMAPVLQGLDPKLKMGLVYFGRESGCALPSGCCTRNATNGGADVPIAPLTQMQKTLLTTWAANNQPSDDNSTPTGPALKGAYEILKQGNLEGNLFVLLITDGEENCLGGLPSQAVTYAGQAVGGTPPVKTFVVGSPGSEDFRQTLSDIAKQGGTPRTSGCTGAEGNACHYDLTSSSNFQQELQTALNEILSGVSVPCVFNIPPQDAGAFDPAKVNVSYTSGGGTAQTIPQDTTVACSQAAGWQYSEDKSQIVLCGSVCQTVQGDANAKIDIVFGCPTETIK